MSLILSLFEVWQCLLTVLFEPCDVSQISAHCMQMNIATFNMEDIELVLLLILLQKLHNQMEKLHSICFFASRYKIINSLHFLSI